MEGENHIEAYAECQKNHSARLGIYATDGCGEYMADDTTPGRLHCAACSCHRNFHRKVTVLCSGGGNVGSGSDKGGSSSSSHSLERDPEVVELIEYDGGQSNPVEAQQPDQSGMRKQGRTRFTDKQKERMIAFAERLGWRIPRKDHEEEIQRFCREIGVPRQSFKVWVQNKKRPLLPTP